VSDRDYKEAAIQRRFGPDPEYREHLNEINKTFNDWKGTCRRCKKVIVGTLADIQAHTCEVESGK